MTYGLIACICILAICQVIVLISFNKKFKKQKVINAQLEENQKNLQKNILNISSLVSKAQNNIEKQYDKLKQMEMMVLQKLNPLLEKNQIVDELRRKIKESDTIISGLRSTILQMSQTFKRMQRAEKEKDAKETVKRKQSKTPVKQ
jgi:uncharacterized phage infection (PIP) family protein YhgE